MTVRIPLSDQIAEAERNRDQAAEMVKDKPELLPRLHAREAIVISLYAYQAFEHEMNWKTK